MGFVPARRDDGASAVTVTGTVTADQGAAAAVAWPVDGSAHTQPISAAALPLPAGAATEATLAALLAALQQQDTTETVDGIPQQRVYDAKVRDALHTLQAELEATPGVNGGT